jgi:hypothetical protein
MDVSTRLRRCARWVGIDRNPLRRWNDRIEAWVRVVLTATVLSSGPFVVWWCGESAYDRAAAAAEWSRNRLFPVHAVILEDSDHGPVYSEDGHTDASVEARWTAPNGTPRTGPVTPTEPNPAGTTVLIWTDVYGNPMEPSTTNPSTSAIGVGLTSALFIIAGYATVLMSVRRLLDGRRMTAWQREWRSVEPRWSGRR